VDHGEANQRAEGWPAMQPHEEYLELCALSTSGELTDEERSRLSEHLVGCSDCRQALKEFETVADIAVPLLSPEVEPATHHSAVPAIIARSQKESGTGHKNETRFSQVNWNYVWIPFAACVLLTASLAIYSYQAGRPQGHVAAQLAPNLPGVKVDDLERQLSDVSYEREMLKTQIAGRDREINELQGQLQVEGASLSDLKSEQQALEAALQTADVQKQQVSDDRTGLSQKLDSTEASLQTVQAELDSIRQDKSTEGLQEASLSEQIKDLTGRLRDREQTINKQEDLLDHDRDIRDLMGARDLYIAEVYDVGRDGATQKPFGRVFYTKGKSLIFYAYDLDRQSGIKTASTFQAWGRRDGDSQQALSLGVFYQDNSSKKRWVLKSDDPVALEQINAVFVTVEPNGGSNKPSGKPLLFAYLKIEPDHP
jgi:hypothetical protein